MRRVFVLLLVVAGALWVVPAIGARAAAPPQQLRYVRVSDGKEIAVKVTYPPDYVAGQRYPAIFEMDGYAGAGADYGSMPGYVSLHASVRGTGCSGGTLVLFSDRSAQDGADVIDGWVPKQPWSNGKVGITGHSYSGLTGFLVAARSPRHLVATAVSGLIDDFYRGILFPGGVPNPGFPILWGGLLRVESEHVPNLDELLSDPHCRANYLQHLGTDAFNLQGLLDTYPHRTAGPNTWAIQQGLMAKIHGINAPIQLGQQYQDEQTGPRGGHVLWENVPAGVPKRFVVSTGRHNPNDPTGTKQDWFDCWILHGGDSTAVLTNGHACADVLDPKQRVLAFFESEGSDRLAPYISSDWPLPETLWTRYYLRADRTLATSPNGGDGSVSYLDTGTGRHLTADVGGIGPGGLGELTYNPALDALPDMARFTLPFASTGAFGGPVALTLWATSTTPDFDFFAEVLDVDQATGTTTFVQRGVLRASLRAVNDARSAKVASGPHAGEIYRAYHPYLHPQLVVPGQATRYEIEIFPLGHVFRAGHALVLQLHATPANDPISTYAWEPSPPAVVTILQDATHRSSVLFPVMGHLPPMRDTQPACGAVIGEICLHS